jgi:hypothetical protein
VKKRKMSEEDKNLPKFVLFEPSYVSWLGFPHAIKDAQKLNVPLAVKTQQEFKYASQFIKSNNIQVDLILLEN